MSATTRPALEVLHRLLYMALIEIRSEGAGQKNKVVFHLADLLHTLPLDLQAVAEGRGTYEEVLGRLEERAREKRCERWLEARLGDAVPPRSED
jgi:hypothetical protein